MSLNLFLIIKSIIIITELNLLIIIKLKLLIFLKNLNRKINLITRFVLKFDR